MTTGKFVPPTFKSTAYHCPRCGAYAKQAWGRVFAHLSTVQSCGPYEASLCSHCEHWALWKEDKILDPSTSPAPPCHADMPKDVRCDYEEAALVLNASPRSSAALLRLAVQKLCSFLGGTGNNINDDIAALVSKGLPDQVQKALDIVRVVGNEQVHPGQLDVRDNPQIAIQLFELVNFITEDQISRPRKIEELYERLPESKLQAIEKRDAKQTTAAAVKKSQ